MNIDSTVRDSDVASRIGDLKAWLVHGGDYYFRYGRFKNTPLLAEATKYAVTHGYDIKISLDVVIKSYESWCQASVFGQPAQKAAQPKRFYRSGELDQLPRVEWLIDGLLPATGTVVLYGREGSGKSFLALRLANIVARDKAVLYVPYEDLPILYQRQAAHDDFFGCQPAADLYYMALDMPVLNEEGAADQFKACLERERIQPGLIIFDTFRASTTGIEENSAKEVGAVIDVLKQIKTDLACSILVVHHMGKETAKGARGSTVITADTDLSFEVEGADFRQERAQLILKNRKNKFAAKQPDLYVDMIQHRDCLVADFAAKKAAVSGNNARVLAAMQKAPRPLTYSEIRDLSQVNAGSVTKSLNWLIKQERIGKSGKLYSLN